MPLLGKIDQKKFKAFTKAVLPNNAVLSEDSERDSQTINKAGLSRDIARPHVSYHSQVRLNLTKYARYRSYEKEEALNSLRVFFEDLSSSILERSSEMSEEEQYAFLDYIIYTLSPQAVPTDHLSQKYLTQDYKSKSLSRLQGKGSSESVRIQSSYMCNTNKLIIENNCIRYTPPAESDIGYDAFEATIAGWFIHITRCLNAIPKTREDSSDIPKNSTFELITVNLIESFMGWDPDTICSSYSSKTTHFIVGKMNSMHCERLVADADNGHGHLSIVDEIAFTKGSSDILVRAHCHSDEIFPLVQQLAHYGVKNQESLEVMPGLSRFDRYPIRNLPELYSTSPKRSTRGTRKEVERLEKILDRVPKRPPSKPAWLRIRSQPLDNRLEMNVKFDEFWKEGKPTGVVMLSFNRIMEIEIRHIRVNFKYRIGRSKRIVGLIKPNQISVDISSSGPGVNFVDDDYRCYFFYHLYSSADKLDDHARLTNTVGMMSGVLVEIDYRTTGSTQIDTFSTEILRGNCLIRGFQSIQVNPVQEI